MRSKMTAIQMLKTEQSRRSNSTSNADNRRNTRRTNTYPYYRNKVNSENCYKCEENVDSLNILNDKIARIENLVENLNKTVKATNMNMKNRKIISPTPSFSSFGSVDLSKMNIEELLCFSSRLGIHFFDILDKEKKKNSSGPIKIESSENKENKVLNDIENEANATSNDNPTK